MEKSLREMSILDVETDFKRIVGFKEGLQQYYDLEQKTDLVSFNSGRVQAKIGINEKTCDEKRGAVSFVVVDNKPHLDKKGTAYFAKRAQAFYLITTNSSHPAFALQRHYPMVHIMFYPDAIDFVDVFYRFKNEFRLIG